MCSYYFSFAVVQKSYFHLLNSAEFTGTLLVQRKCMTYNGNGMGLKLLPGKKLARMAFMVDFSFT